MLGRAQNGILRTPASETGRERMPSPREGDTSSIVRSERRRGGYLVTGGAGFIGSHLTEALVGRGDRVVVLDDLSTGRRRNLAGVLGCPGFRLETGSVVDEELVDDLVEECEVVVHLASAVGVDLIVRHPLSSMINNLRGDHAVLAAAARHGRKVLLASSSEIYGKSAASPLSEDSDRVLGSPRVARWAYSTTKEAAEALAYAYEKERGLATVVVRIFNTVGPRQRPDHGMVVPRMIREATAGQPLTIHGDGRQTRCFCHVADLVRALIGLLDEESAVGQVFNVGSTEEVTVLDLATRIRTIAGTDTPIRFVPYDEAYGAGFEDVARRVPDITRLVSLTGWAPARSLDDILRELLAGSSEDERLAVGQGEGSGG